MTKLKEEPKPSRAGIVFGTNALGIIAVAACFALMMFLGGMGDQYFGDAGSMIGVLIGVAVFVFTIFFLIRNEKTELAKLNADAKHG